MPRTKPRTAARPKPAAPPAPTDVLTLTEAAAYLRVSADELLEIVNSQDVPARQIGKEWRFLKPALQAWLSAPAKTNGLLAQFGRAKDHPDMEEMLADIYRRRGRPMTEEG